MPRDSAILYRNSGAKGNDPASYTGLLRLVSGATYWVAIWPRIVKGRAVVELRLSGKKDE